MSWMPTIRNSRVVIEEVSPSFPGDNFYVKRVLDEPVSVSAFIYADGHQALSADLLFREVGGKNWKRTPMEFKGNDAWGAEFTGGKIGYYEFIIEGWINEYKTWLNDLEKRKKAGQDLSVEYRIGKSMIKEVSAKAVKRESAKLEKSLSLIEMEENPYALFFDPVLIKIMRCYPDKRNMTCTDQPVQVFYQRKKALFSTWYEMFPRSLGDSKELLKSCLLLQRWDLMLSIFHRFIRLEKLTKKGKTTVPKAKKQIREALGQSGSEKGGHDAIDPGLGTTKDFNSLIAAAKKIGY